MPRWPGGVIRKTPVAPSGGTASGVWSMADVAYYKKQGLWPTVPQAPTIGTATAGTSGCASVTFTAPTCTGTPSTITGYLVTSTPGCITKTGASSPITVTGLSAGTAYTFKVKAQNAAGYGACSAASNSATPAVVGQQAYTSAGTYSWVAPAGVTSVSVVAVGGGGVNGGSSYGGAGGGLGYKNNYAVTPGNSYTVVVGGSTGASYFVNASTVAGNAGQNSGAGGTYVGDGGGNGGGTGSRAGGGAGGYAGNGGSGAPDIARNGLSGSGGGGGGGATSAYAYGCCCIPYSVSGSGGGVGILGQGANGAGGTYSGCSVATGGGGGSGGTSGAQSSGGGVYGGGSARGYTSGGGAVRIIWPGSTRKFPSTCTGNK